MQHKKHKKNNKTVELHNKTHNLVKKEFPKSVCIKMICRDWSTKSTINRCHLLHAVSIDSISCD